MPHAPGWRRCRAVEYRFPATAPRCAPRRALSHLFSGNRFETATRTSSNSLSYLVVVRAVSTNALEQNGQLRNLAAQPQGPRDLSACESSAWSFIATARFSALVTNASALEQQPLEAWRRRLDISRSSSTYSARLSARLRKQGSTLPHLCLRGIVYFSVSYLRAAAREAQALHVRSLTPASRQDADPQTVGSILKRARACSCGNRGRSILTTSTT